MMHGREKSDPPVGRPAWPVRWTLLSKEFVALRTPSTATRAGCVELGMGVYRLIQMSAGSWIEVNEV